MEGFIKADKKFNKQAKKNNDQSGTTATVVILIGNTLFTANVGDSTAILAVGPNKEPIKMTTDHKASDESEKKRVKAAGGIVVWFGGGFRVNGTMAVSRSIGDEPIGVSMTPEPDIFEHQLTDADDFVILATDVLWDVFSSMEATEFVYNWRTSNKESEENVSQALVDEALRRNSGDNITAAVIFLKSAGTGIPPHKIHLDWNIIESDRGEQQK